MVIARFVGFFSVNNNDGSRKEGGRGFLLPLSFEEISDRLFAVAGLFHFRFQADSLGEAPEIGLPPPPISSFARFSGFAPTLSNGVFVCFKCFCCQWICNYEKMQQKFNQKVKEKYKKGFVSGNYTFPSLNFYGKCWFIIRSFWEILFFGEKITFRKNGG